MSKVFLIFALLPMMIACSATHQASSVKPSGFLGDYSQLKEGKSGEALLRYINPAADWKKYNKVMLYPVTIYAGKTTDLAKANKEEQQALAGYFTAALREELSKDYTLVSSAGPNVLKIRVAITDADESEPVLNTFTTIMPIGLAVSSLKRAVTGSDSFVGSAQAELEITDSQSGRRLAAVVDNRLGTKALRSKFGGAWNDAKYAFDYWAETLRERLEELKNPDN